MSDVYIKRMSCFSPENIGGRCHQFILMISSAKFFFDELFNKEEGIRKM